ncbi:PRC-barrel domain-containing protein [Microvirga sp. 2TAF3]|uniref:PRC-barrel domain-containing protein n=1 Tax=Microvirga sp. 2TAF3 TaxID=3233014 RepID=UPI003F9AE42D
MLKKHMAACLVATIFAAPAFAQTSTSPSNPSTSGAPAVKQDMTNPPANPAMNSSAAPAGAMSGQFMTQLQGDQMMASDLIGTKVISANNESIGDINDVIVDRKGQAVAAVVGVGGFLGIGEKDVAVPFNSLEFATREQVRAMNNNKSTMNTTGNNVSTTGSTATNNNAVNATGSTTTATGATANSANNEPERVILRMTKAELQAAPSFDKDRNDAVTGTAAPKQ